MWGMVGGRLPPKQEEQKVKKVSPIEQIRERAAERGTAPFIGELIEMLLVSGHSFDDVRKMTLEDFEKTVEAVIKEAETKLEKD